MTDIDIIADVVVDRTDDVATVVAIYSLQARDATVLAVPVMPSTKSGKAVCTEILTALSRRRADGDHITGHASWDNLRRLLIEAGIYRLILLYAQNIAEPALREVVAELAGIDITPTFIFVGSRSRLRPTTTLQDLVASSGQPRPRQVRAPAPMPEVPRVHPLRFRYDCRCDLADHDFILVDQALGESYTRISRWLCAQPDSLDPELKAPLTQAIRHSDYNLQRIRSTAAELALIAARRSGLEAGTASQQIASDDERNDTFGRRPRRLDLDGPQIHKKFAPGPTIDSAWPYTLPRPTTGNELLHALLHTARTSVPDALLDHRLRKAAEPLVQQGILWHADGRLGATQVARYSIYHRDEPPVRQWSGSYRRAERELTTS